MMKKIEVIVRLCICSLLLTGLLGAARIFAQDVAVDNAGVAETLQSDDSIWALIVKGGPVMIPLGIASIIALAISFERFVSLRKRRIVPADFLGGLKAAVDLDPVSLDKAVEFCEINQTPAGRIFKQGLVNVYRGADAAERAVEDAGAREVDKMKRSLRGLQIIASVAPLMGLLGTVYGMIGAFKLATEAGMGKADVLASGIYEALVTTATGLTIAIPVLLLFQFFSARVDNIVDEIDEHGIEFIQHIFRRKTDAVAPEVGA